MYNNKGVGHQQENIFYTEIHFLKNFHNLLFLVILRKAQSGENCERENSQSYIAIY